MGNDAQARAYNDAMISEPTGTATYLEAGEDGKVSQHSVTPEQVVYYVPSATARENWAGNTKMQDAFGGQEAGEDSRWNVESISDKTSEQLQDTYDPTYREDAAGGDASVSDLDEDDGDPEE